LMLPDGPSTIAKELYRLSILQRGVPPVVGWVSVTHARCVMVGSVGVGGVKCVVVTAAWQ
jgi:hypothetical protein